MPVDHSVLIATAGRAFAFDRPAVVGVAVSGGGDSLALLHLMAEAAPRAGWRIEAATVDHRLRPAAADEALGVAAICASLGIPHQVLVWDSPKGPGNLMDRARRARLRLLAEWAGRRGIGHVALGHTADDQAETFLMGLSRAAGIDGLCGMRPAFREGGVVFARPLLEVPRQTLRSYLAARGLDWIDDPTNDDEAFARVRARRALTTMRPLGITAAKLAAVADHLAMARSALDTLTMATARRLVVARGGAIFLDRPGFVAEPAEVQRRLALAALRALTGAGHPPRERELNRVLWVLTAGGKTTLRGVLVDSRADQALFRREWRAVAEVIGAADGLWDGRWRIDGPWQGDEEIRALGPAGLRACPDWRATGLTRQVLEVTPAVWRAETLVAAPCAGFGPGWTAKTVPDFQTFLLAH